MTEEAKLALYSWLEKITSESKRNAAFELLDILHPRVGNPTNLYQDGSIYYHGVRLGGRKKFTIKIELTGE